MRRSTSETSPRRRAARCAVAALLASAVLAGCGDELPTATHPSTPVDPLTFEVRLPWSQFAGNLRVLGGFAEPIDAPTGLIAHQFGGDLEARTIVRFPNLPTSISVLDSLGTTRTDTVPNFVGSNVVVQLDTISNTNVDPVLIRVSRVDAPWDARTATWELAVDSPGVQIPWPQPGGGPLIPLSEASWVGGGTNQVLLPLDSAETAFLRDTTQANRGIVVTLETPEQRLEVQRVFLQLQVIPSIHQDTLVFVDVAPDPAQFTYIYTPEAAPPPPDELRAGGVPAWRSVFTLALPESVPGTAAVCAVTTCPVTLTADRINHASLLLTTRPGDASFAPSDTMSFEIRGVIAPEVLPKSPLASPQFVDQDGLPVGTKVQAAAFQPGTPRVVELSISPLLRNLVSGATGLFGPTPTITLMEVGEPLSFSYGTFAGPGQPGEPVLRLLITVSDPVELP